MEYLGEEALRWLRAKGFEYGARRQSGCGGKGRETVWCVDGSVGNEKERERARETGVENRVKSRCCRCHKVGAALYRRLKAKRRSTFQSFTRASWISSPHTCYHPSCLSPSSLRHSLRPFAYRNKFFWRRDAADASRRYIAFPLRIPSHIVWWIPRSVPRLLFSYLLSTLPDHLISLELEPSKGIKKRCCSFLA